MRVIYVLLCSASLMMSCGCSDSSELSKKPIALDKVPSQILKIAQDKYPDVVFEAAFTETEGGKSVYELKGKNNIGKNYEVEVTKDGTILNP